MGYSCGYEDGKRAQAMWKDTPTARKQHRCWMCGDPIEPGEQYVSRVRLLDGEISCCKQHEECDDQALFLWGLNYAWDGPVGFGEAWAHAWGGEKAVDDLRARRTAE